MDPYVTRAPEHWTAVRLSIEARDDDVIKTIFNGVEYIAGFEALGENKHYHIMVVGVLTDAVKQRKSRYARGRSGASSWSKPNWGTWDKGVAYTIKDGEWFASSEGLSAYARGLPAYSRPVDDQDAPVNPQDRKKVDWPLTERNIVRLYRKYKHNVPEMDGKHDFFLVLQWIVRNTNWKLNKYFMSNLTEHIVRRCETGDDGDEVTIERLRRQCRSSPY